MALRSETIVAPGYSQALQNVLACALTLLAIAWAGDLYRSVGLVLFTEQYLGAILAVGLALVFLAVPPRKGERRTRVPWYDMIAALAGFLASAYVAVEYPSLMNRLVNVPADAVVVSVILFALCMEALRRTVDIWLFGMIAVCVGYALVAHWVPGAFRSRPVDLDRLVSYIVLDTSGLLGMTLATGATVVLAFMFFGQILTVAGGGNFFMDISIALMGRFRGGAAKICILGSSLFGTVSGAVVPNILTVGVVTIPLMKRSGYSATYAAAIEAVASTGGQIMPPVMGIVAFIMAEFLQVSYGQVVIAAIVPALLYYVALFIQADLEAAKGRIGRIDPATVPSARASLASGWFFALPFAVLIMGLFWLNVEPQTAALYAGIAVIACGLVFGYKGERLGLRTIFSALVKTGLGALDILFVCAAAGFLIGVMNITGLAFSLSLVLVQIGQGSLLLLLVLTALMAIVLGMGLPSVTIYIMQAVLIAPALIKLGISPMAAHMFIFYFGMMSYLTPPLALGAYAAANIAGSDFFRTGWVSCRFGWVAYVVPFLFVYSPSLLLDGSLPELLIDIPTALGGVWLVSIGFVGYLRRSLSGWRRAGFICAGLALVLPSAIAPYAVEANVAGLILAAGLLAWEQRIGRNRRLSPTGTSSP